jgi:hypothetical protein
MAYVKKLSQFLYCDLYGTTLTCKHKDIHSFNQLTVVSMQLITACYLLRIQFVDFSLQAKFAAYDAVALPRPTATGRQW